MKKILVIQNKKVFKQKNLLFYDEYLHSLYYNNKIIKKNYFYNLNHLKKINYNSNLLHKKISQYRSELGNLLNIIHNENINEKNWGLLLDKLIFFIVNPIIVETLLLKKILISNKNLSIFQEKLNSFYLDVADFTNSYYADNRFAYVRYVIAKNIGFSIIKNKKKIKKIKKKSFNLNERYSTIIFRLLVSFYVKIFKPNLLVNSYLGVKNSIIIFFKSFGRILCIPSKYIFNYNISLTRKNFKIREKIMVKETDFIDKIFNILIKDFIPASYLENFKKYYSIDKETGVIPSLGSAVSIIYDDKFKFLSVKLLEKKKNIFSLQHGFIGKETKERSVYDTIYQKKYSSKVIDWYSKRSSRENFFDKYKKYKFEPETRDKILIYPTTIMDRPNYKNNLSKKFHPYLNLNYDFFKTLNKDLKNKVSIKAFPGSEGKIKNFWFEKFNKRNLFIKNSKNIFHNFRIVIIDDISTPICELLYVGAPFILIESEFQHFNKKTKKKLLALKKINILFENPVKAGEFLNRNYENLNSWWRTTIRSKIYLSLKKEFLPFKQDKGLKEIIKNYSNGNS